MLPPLPSALLLALPAALALFPPPPEVEPNDTRDTATPVTLSPTVPAFTGLSRGSATTGAAELTRDYWRLTLTVNPLVIYKHSFTVSTTGTAGHTGSIAGHQRTGDVDSGGGVISLGTEDPASIAILQSTTISTNPARTNVCYSLGQSAPWLLYRVVGGPSTTSNYTVTLASTPVTPTPIDCPFAAGPITITTVGQNATNTELFLFDEGTLSPVAANDDTPVSAALPAGSPQSTLVRTLAAGRYVLALGNFDTATNLPPGADDRARFQSVTYLSDSPGLLINSSSGATADLTFQITDAFATQSPHWHKRTMNAAKPGAYGLAFYSFTVIDAAPCGRADIGRQGGGVCWDGLLDNNDFITFTTAFFGHDVYLADLGVQGGTYSREHGDNAWNNEDWIVFIDLFFQGCGAF